MEKLQSILDSAKTDYKLFTEKGNNAAGTRLRKAMQELVVEAKAIRVKVQETKNSK